MAGGDDLSITPSKISNTVFATRGLLDNPRKMVQKSGDVTISFPRGPDSWIHRAIPFKTSGADFDSRSGLKLDIVWRTTGTLMKEFSYTMLVLNVQNKKMEADTDIADIK